MNETFRIRKLEPVGPGDYDRTKRSGWRVVAFAGAVYDIKQEELRLTAQEVTLALNAGRLGSNDLVWGRDGWQSLIDHDDFVQPARRRARIETARRVARWCSLLLLVCGLRIWAGWPR